jgi:hypothetical protein
MRHIAVARLKVPGLELTLYSLVGAGPLFIISKLFIYLAGLLEPFLGSGEWVKEAGWRCVPNLDTSILHTDSAITGWAWISCCLLQQQLWVGRHRTEQSG